MNYDVELYAKIEKFDAIENIDAILQESDGLMVARADLGIELPFYEVPTLQKNAYQKQICLQKPVITASNTNASL
ncbi:MAG: pyruvate kinase [Sulfurimonas sp.]|nr:pyruvate kinase [Sulfurimonas sp.]